MADRRRHERYPLWEPARVWWDGASGPVEARVTDLSLAGAAIEVPGAFQADRLVIELSVGGHHGRFHAEAVDRESSWYATIIHARFVAVPPTKRPVLERIVRAAANEYSLRMQQMLELDGTAG